MIAKALNEKVVVNEQGRRRRITKREAIAKQLVNKAASGGLRVMRELQALERFQLTAAQAEKRSAFSEPESVQPPVPQIDFSEMSTRELQILQEAFEIIEGRQAGQDLLPMTPADPGEELE